MHDNRLKSLPAATIIRAISDAADRWSDADFPPRVRGIDAIAKRTGYSIPVVEYALDQLFFGITRESIEKTIAAELGSVQTLDAFTAGQGKPERFARGLDKVCIISSRTTIGVALVPALFALCAKSHVTVKDREDHFIGAFFETLAEEDDAFSTAAVAEPWDGANASVDLSGFDAVVAFGKNATLKEIRARCSSDCRFIGFGSRASAGYVTREALQDAGLMREIAAGAARDLALYESEGCLSLHVLFLEAGDDAAAAAFMQTFAAAMQASAIEFPPGSRDPKGIAQTAQFRNLAAFRAAGGRGTVFSDEDASFALAFDPPIEDSPAFAPRTVGVIPVSQPADALAYLDRHGIQLEGFALSDARADLVEAGVSAGAVRLAPFGELQRLPVSGDHGGRPRIADYIRWIDKEF